MVRDFENLLVFTGCNIFASIQAIKRYMKDTISRLHEAKTYDLIMAASNLSGDIINTRLFADEDSGYWIIVYVLMEMKCSLFSVFLSSFHMRGRRCYIRAIKVFERKCSVIYTMIYTIYTIYTIASIISSKMQRC